MPERFRPRGGRREGNPTAGEQQEDEPMEPVEHARCTRSRRLREEDADGAPEPHFYQGLSHECTRDGGDSDYITFSTGCAAFRAPLDRYSHDRWCCVKAGL